MRSPYRERHPHAFSVALRAWYGYQRMFWYVGQSVNEIWGKPLRLVDNVLIVTTALAVHTGIRFSLWKIAVFYVGMMVVLWGIGWILTHKAGVVTYNNRLANSQNEEIMRIKEKVEKIAQKLGIED